jgi:hypothetical protein
MARAFGEGRDQRPIEDRVACGERMAAWLNPHRGLTAS